MSQFGFVSLEAWISSWRAAGSMPMTFKKRERVKGKVWHLIRTVSVSTGNVLT